MIMKPSLKADKFSKPQSKLNAKTLGYFKACARCRVALPSLRFCILELQ